MSGDSELGIKQLLEAWFTNPDQVDQDPRYAVLKDKYQKYCLDPRTKGPGFGAVRQNLNVLTKCRFIIEEYLGGYQVVNSNGLNNYLNRKKVSGDIPFPYNLICSYIDHYLNTNQLHFEGRPPAMGIFPEQGITIYGFVNDFSIKPEILVTDIFHAG